MRHWFSLERTRRTAIAVAFGSLVSIAAPQEQPPSDDRRVKPPDLEDDPRLPDGRSQKNAIAKDEHERALREANELLRAAEELRDELRKADSDGLSADSYKKTDEIERLARRIRARLKF
jgi:hypothetical protein